MSQDYVFTGRMKMEVISPFVNLAAIVRFALKKKVIALIAAKRRNTGLMLLGQFFLMKERFAILS